MGEAPPSTPLTADLLVQALDTLATGSVVFDPDWTIVHVNPAGAALVGRVPQDLVDRNIWVALPEVGGTIFHSFLLHARNAGRPVTWQGFYAPTRRWIRATAVLVGDLLHVEYAEVPDPQPGDPPVPGRAATPDADPRDAGPDDLRFLTEVSEIMISTLDTGESVAKLLDLVVPRLCDWATVTVVGEGGRPAEAGRAHRDPDRLVDLDRYLAGRVSGTPDDAPMIAALLSGEPVHQSTVTPEAVQGSLPTDEVREAWQRLDAGSFTVVPLRARKETFGVLAMVNAADREPHSEMEIATAVEVARRASLALDNARLYQQQVTVAETLQHSLLTPPPRPDGLQIAVRYQPASQNMYVGGDWYDAFQHDGATLLVIGDVVGHNVDAAAAMGQVRSITRGIAFDRREEPAQLLARVDDVLTGLHIGTLATALIARLDPPVDPADEGVRALRWSSAGHLPPLLLRPGGSTEVLATTPETLLGTESRHPRSDHQVLLHPGDTVLFYTDGLVEQGRIDIDDGIDRLAALLTELGHLPVEELADGLLARIVTDSAEDDVAVIALRCSPRDDAGG